MAQDDLLTVEQICRPARIAFIIDPTDKDSVEQLDSVIEGMAR
jgi:hypothetical protein